jgi:hypothetical protein
MNPPSPQEVLSKAAQTILSEMSRLQLPCLTILAEEGGKLYTLLATSVPRSAAQNLLTRTGKIVLSDGTVVRSTPCDPPSAAS